MHPRRVDPRMYVDPTTVAAATAAAHARLPAAARSFAGEIRRRKRRMDEGVDTALQQYADYRAEDERQHMAELTRKEMRRESKRRRTAAPAPSGQTAAAAPAPTASAAPARDAHAPAPAAKTHTPLSQQQVRAQTLRHYDLHGLRPPYAALGIPVPQPPTPIHRAQVNPAWLAQMTGTGCTCNAYD
jgi:hypothetical protein